MKTLSSSFQQTLGLMFQPKAREPVTFLFKQPVSKSIHAWFVFVPFIAQWYAKENLIEQRLFLPWDAAYKPDKPFTTIVETPIGYWQKEID